MRNHCYRPIFVGDITQRVIDNKDTEKIKKLLFFTKKIYFVNKCQNINLFCVSILGFASLNIVLGKLTLKSIGTDRKSDFFAFPHALFFIKLDKNVGLST